MRIDITPSFHKAGAQDWKPWFAWRSVCTGNHVVWLEYVERRWDFQAYDGWIREYRLIGEEKC